MAHSAKFSCWIVLLLLVALPIGGHAKPEPDSSTTANRRLNSGDLDLDEVMALLNLSEPKFYVQLRDSVAAVEHRARVKQFAGLLKGREKLPVKVGETISVPALSAPDLRALVEGWKPPVPARAQPGLARWLRQLLEKQFGYTYEIILRKGQGGSLDRLLMPTYIRDYSFQMVSKNGKAVPGTYSFGPRQLSIGSQFELLMVDDQENPDAANFRSVRPGAPGH